MIFDITLSSLHLDSESKFHQIEFTREVGFTPFRELSGSQGNVFVPGMPALEVSWWLSY